MTDAQIRKKFREGLTRKMVKLLKKNLKGKDVDNYSAYLLNGDLVVIDLTATGLGESSFVISNKQKGMHIGWL